MISSSPNKAPSASARSRYLAFPPLKNKRGANVPLLKIPSSLSGRRSMLK